MIDFACVSSTTPTWSNDPCWCIPGIAATEAEHAKLAADRASSAPMHGVHRYYPFVVEDRGRLGKSALTVVYIFAVLLAVRNFPGVSGVSLIVALLLCESVHGEPRRPELVRGLSDPTFDALIAADGRPASRGLRQVGSTTCNGFHVESYPGLPGESGCESHCASIGTDACLAFAFDNRNQVCFLKLACGKAGWEPSRFPSAQDMLVPVRTDEPLKLPPSVGGGEFVWEWPTGPGWAPAPPSPSSPPRRRDPTPPARQTPAATRAPVEAPSRPDTPRVSEIDDTAEKPGASPEFQISRDIVCKGQTFKREDNDTRSECQRQCAGNIRCNAFVYNIRTSACLLKSGCGNQAAAESYHYTGIKIAENTAAVPSQDVVVESGERAAADWGSNREFTAQCRSSGQSYYFCNADCAANCADMGLNGLLVPTVLQGELQFCHSQHTRSEYGDSACCCGEHYIGPTRLAQVIPCPASVPAAMACDTWCRLHSAPLGQGSKVDCSPGRSWCFPFGLLASDPTCVPMECSQDKQCCCQNGI
eukprot:jgi/Tetstr1/443350/TSEL_031365.t1